MEKGLDYLSEACFSALIKTLTSILSPLLVFYLALHLASQPRMPSITSGGTLNRFVIWSCTMEDKL